MVVSPQPPTDDYAPSERVIRVVADEADVAPLDLPPLHYAMDTDVLDAAIAELEEGSIQFSYDGWLVTAYGDGTVEVTERAPTAAQPRETAADD